MKNKKFTLFVIVLLFVMSINTCYCANIFQTSNYVVYDRNHSIVVMGKNEHKSVPMASTTKIMTAIIALENGILDSTVVVSKNAQNVIGWQLNLREGDRISLIDLLYAIMLYSANDGAIAIAEHISGSVDGFSKLMNKKARELGLTDTNFTSPHGLDDVNHFSSPYDMAIIMDYALTNDLFRKIISSHSYEIMINNNKRVIESTNKALNSSNYCVGGKTGYTGNAMYCLACNYVKNENDFIIVTLGSNTSNVRFSENIELFDYSIENYTLVNSENIIKPRIMHYIDKCKESIYVIPKSKYLFWINNAELDCIEVVYNLSITGRALPIKIGEKLFRCSIFVGDKSIIDIDYITDKEYIKKGCFDYCIFILNNYIKMLRII